MIAGGWVVDVVSRALPIVVIVSEGKAVVGWGSFAVVGEGAMSPGRRGRRLLAVHLCM